MSEAPATTTTEPAAPAAEPAAPATPAAPPAEPPAEPAATMAGGKPAAKDGEPGEPAAAGAPDSYEPFTVPEGKQLDTALLEVAAPVFKEQQFTQAQGQAIVDLQFKAQEAAEQAAQTMRDGWKKEIASDPEIGGANMEASQQRIRELVAWGAPPELATWLNETGFGDYPALNKFLHKIAQEFGEDKLSGTQAGSVGGPKSPTELLYGPKE